MRRTASDRWALGAPLGILVVALVTLPPLPEPIRIVAAALMSAVVPGIALEQALGSRSADPLRRALTVVASSVALSILIGLLVDTLGIDLTRTSRVVSVGVGSLLLCAVGIARGGGTASPLQMRPRVAIGVVVTAVLLGALTVTAAVIATDAARDLDADSPVTSLWIAPGAGACTVGITQRHEPPGTYTLAVRAGDDVVQTKTVRSDGDLDLRLTPDVVARVAGPGELRATLTNGSGVTVRRAAVELSACRAA